LNKKPRRTIPQIGKRVSKVDDFDHFWGIFSSKMTSPDGYTTCIYSYIYSWQAYRWQDVHGDPWPKEGKKWWFLMVFDDFVDFSFNAS
jgi:hypothetical protein